MENNYGRGIKETGRRVLRKLGVVIRFWGCSFII